MKNFLFIWLQVVCGLTVIVGSACLGSLLLSKVYQLFGVAGVLIVLVFIASLAVSTFICLIDNIDNMNK